jgi:hypothetical protein
VFRIVSNSCQEVHMTVRRQTLSILLVSLLALAVAAEPLRLSPEQVERKGAATFTVADGVIDLRFDDPGWDSGVKVLPPAGETVWDLSGWRVLSADITNVHPARQMRLTMHISSGSREDKTLRQANTGIALNPGETRTMRLLIPHRSLYAAPKGVPGPRTLDTARISGIEFYMQWPFEGKQDNLLHCRIGNLRTEEPVAKGAEAVPEDQYFPFIDTFGQYAHADWPEKVHSLSDLRTRHAQELRELADSPRPEEWDRFGGWRNGPTLEATGSFRTEKYEGKWYMVDPDGRLFFSLGLDVLHAHTDATKTAKHEAWFQSPSPESGVLPFTDLNLQAKYGKEDYAADFYRVLGKRLEHWGMNSIGDWGNSKLIAVGGISYTLQLTDYNWKMPRLKASKLKFYDVFDPRYVDGMKNLVATVAARDPLVTKSLTDPFCIGYFIDNELNFGNRGRQMLGDDVLRCPPEQASKKEFCADLAAKYGGIAKLNAAWETDYASWDALLERTDVPTSKGFKTDSDIFFRKAVDQYFRLCRDAVKSVAPNRLYLGCRFISTDAVRRPLYETSAKYCDVLSTNVYSHSTANLGTGDFPDMPVLIGEFHFGVYDRGMFSPGLCPAGITQGERALAFTRYVQGALAHPNIVGAHWFQFRDQPLTGRWDGEGYAIGFVDVADTPYVEMTRASRDVGEHMYQYRLNGVLKNAMK